MQREITSIFTQNKVILRETKRAVTPYGGLAVFVEYLKRIGYSNAIHTHMPVCLNSPNAIDPTETFTAFLISVLSGARRFAHAGLLRLDKAMHCVLGIVRFPTDDTMKNLFKRFSQRFHTISHRSLGVHDSSTIHPRFTSIHDSLPNSPNSPYSSPLFSFTIMIQNRNQVK